MTLEEFKKSIEKLEKCPVYLPLSLQSLWYNRSPKPESKVSLDEEWDQIASQLLLMVN